MRTPTASILMPVFNEAPFLAASVASALAQAVDGDVELLLIDGASTDTSRALATDFAAADPRVRVLDNPRRAIPVALNIGLAAARGEFVVRMDAHTTYPADYIRLGIERLRRGGADWVSGPVLPDAQRGFARCVAAALLTPLGQGGSRKWGDVNAAEFELDTGVFAGVWHRSTLDRLGGWDERFAACEDAQMAARVLESGGRLVCLPAMAARYVPRATPAGLWRQYWRFGSYRVRMCREHPVALRPGHLVSAAIAGAVAGSVLPGRLGRIARGPALAWAGLVAFVGARDAPTSRPADRAGTAVALGVMHLSWGSGFVVTCLRGGPPFAALAGLLRRRS